MDDVLARCVLQPFRDPDRLRNRPRRPRAPSAPHRARVVADAVRRRDRRRSRRSHRPHGHRREAASDAMPPDQQYRHRDARRTRHPHRARRPRLSRLLDRCRRSTHPQKGLTMHTRGELQVYPDSAALAQAAADLFVNVGQMAMADRGAFRVALAGGNTPRAAYELLAQEPRSLDLSWSDVYVYFGDERCVPHDDEQSNYRMARKAFLDAVPI